MNSSPESEGAVLAVYRALLGREPAPGEAAMWAAEFERHAKDFRWLFSCFVASKEFIEKTRIRPPPGHPPGHYYSPIVDPAEAAPYVTRRGMGGVEQLRGVALDLGAMKALWDRAKPSISGHRFPVQAEARCRYYGANRNFPPCDALILRAMIGLSPPRRIVEVGSGFSTAVMLDAIDEFGLAGIRVTCIEPDPERLESLLRAEDRGVVEIVRQPVQSVGLERFANLERDDILFIDSSHVLKSGSDVHFELFEVLPILKSGVRVHFHDIQFPFEYPLEWIETWRYSWNEAYAVHAFLLYNSAFRILFFSSLFVREFHEEALETSPYFKNPGGSLWIERL